MTANAAVPQTDKRAALRAGAATLLALVLAGCASAPSSPPAVSRPEVDPAALLARLRTQAATEGAESVDVVPLRDAERAHRLARARALTGRGEIPTARAEIAAALAQAPDDPELLQEAAELALLERDWEGALSLASRSYEHGPRLGELCRRNWLLVGAVRGLHADSEGEAVARHRLGLCSPPPPVRM